MEIYGTSSASCWDSRLPAFFFLFTGSKLPESKTHLNGSIKVAEHSFQVLMPNSPLLLNYLSFGASFLQESRLTTKVFILAFWLGCVAVAMATELIKNKAYKMVFVFIVCPLRINTKSLLSTLFSE